MSDVAGNPDSVKWSGRRCPKCQAELLTDGEHDWCSLIGCDFGIAELVGSAGPDVTNPAPEYRRTASALRAGAGFEAAGPPESAQGTTALGNWTSPAVRPAAPPS